MVHSTKLHLAAVIVITIVKVIVQRAVELHPIAKDSALNMLANLLQVLHVAYILYMFSNSF